MVSVNQKCKKLINQFQNIPNELLVQKDKNSLEELSKAQSSMQETIIKQLKQFEQIKYNLEAWEICKNKLNLKVQTEEAVTEGFCMKGYWLLVEQYPYTQTTILEQEEYEILKKALEMEENV